MPCKNHFTTPTGTFTAFPGLASECEAKKLCAEKGQILAPFTTEEDVQAVTDMFENNDKDCEHSWYKFKDYRVGLNFIKVSDGVFRKEFTNGVQWDDKKHSSLYNINPEQKQTAPVATFEPYTGKGKDLFYVGNEYKGFKYPQRLGYMCLAQAGQATSMGLTHNQESSSQIGMFVLAGLCALVAVVSTCMAVFYRKKNIELKEKMETGSHGV